MNNADHQPGGSATFDPELVKVWEAVRTAYPLMIEHVTGPTRHGGIHLLQVVRAFHEHSVALRAALHPTLLTTMFERFPDGAFHDRAFADRSQTDTLANDVAAIWQECSEALRKAREEAAERASWLTITDEPWNPDTLPPRPWVAPPYLMRQEITLLHGPGGGGKWQLCIAWAVALALGREFGRLKPVGRFRAYLWPTGAAPPSSCDASPPPCKPSALRQPI